MTGNSWLDLNSSLTVEQEAVLEDHRLLSGLQAGEESAYELLIARYHVPIYNLAWRLLNDPADANDVLQEVFLKVFRGVNSFRGDCSLRTWLYRIAVNESHNRRRWLSRHRRGETAIDTSADESETRELALFDDGDSPFDFAVNREAQLLLEEGLASISPVFRSVLVLRELEDMPYDEIAQILEISIGTVKSRLVRGREALRHYLAQRLETGPAIALVPGLGVPSMAARLGK